MSVKTAAIILFHGSRADGAGETARRIINDVRRNGCYDIVTEAFLQHASPGLLEAIAFSAGQQARRVVIVPFFLQVGTHVTADIPIIIEEARKGFPDLTILVADAVGAHPRMAEIIIDLAKMADSRAGNNKA
jgi:sirohydrochlorin ferrochelatase